LGENTQTVQLLQQARNRFQSQGELPPGDLDVQLAWAMLADRQRDPRDFLLNTRARTDLTAKQRAAIDEIFTEDCVFYEPRGAYRGRDEIDRVAGAIKATHPDFQYQPIAEPEELGNGGRVKWVAGRPGEAPAYAGTDFIIARDGRIAAVYLFFDELP
jgi:hypothetical protein